MHCVGDQQRPDSAVQSITSPIMSTQESDSNTGTTATEPSKEVTTDVSHPDGKSPDTSVKSLVSVVNNTSALGSSAKDSSGEDTTGHPSSVPDVVNESEGKSSEDAEPELKESTESTESAASSSGDTNTPTDPCGKTQAGGKSVSADSMGSEDTGGLDFLGSSLLPSDMALDHLLKDMTGNGSGGEASAMSPLDISEVISSFGELPDESSATVTDDAVTTTVQGAACDSDTETRSSSQGSTVGDDNNLATRRQSPRRGPSATKLTPVSSLAETSSPNTSGTFKLEPVARFRGLKFPHPPPPHLHSPHILLLRRNGCQFIYPQPRAEFYKRSLCYSGGVLWNSLPLEVRQSTFMYVKEAQV